MKTKAILVLLLVSILVLACQVKDRPTPQPRYKIIVDGATYHCWNWHTGTEWITLVGCTGYSGKIRIKLNEFTEMAVYPIEKEE